MCGPVLLRVVTMQRFLAVFIWGAVCLSVAEQRSLDDYIQHYEEVNIDPVALHRDHDRVRRSIDSHLYLKFKAYNRDFHLKLSKEKSVFSPTHETYDDRGFFHHVDTSFIYQGEVLGAPRSFVHLSVINGTVRGHINIPGETTYHIEPAEQYIKDPHFHSVIYDERHVNLDPYRQRRDAEQATCGNDHHFEWMKRVSESAYQPFNRAKRTTNDFTEYSSFHNKYSESMNRKKRALKNLGAKNTCYLYLRSDPMLWNYVKKKKYPSPELTDARVKEEILAFFASHVVALKAIYSNTVFRTYDDSMSYRGINFLVQRTKIMTDATEKCNTASATPWCNPNIDVSNFLNLNSMDNHNDFCLAYVFTYRDFTQGTLGLAWVGSETNGPFEAAGGICEKYKEYPEGKERVKKSLNTGIVTIVNYGKQVQARVSQLTFAHEVGHNFGSPHDKGPSCAPYGTNQFDASKGNYIMFASATMGDKEHNDEFSTCSKDNITRVLDAIVSERNGKINCFNSSQTAFCGNGIVEEGEACDCGYESDCRDTDQCCYGKGSTEGKECTLRAGKDCSPTAGPCCTRECTFQPIGSMLCKKKDDCSRDAYCNGTSAQCPSARLEANNTFCNSYSQVCTSGECRGSVCQKIGWEECFLTSSSDSNAPSREELCFVSCRKTSKSPCVSSFTEKDINLPENVAFKNLLIEVAMNLKNSSRPKGIQLPAGSPCDNFRGYCDVFHRCRGVDADGPLARLKNLIFSPETLQSIRDWIVVHWWAVMLMGIGLVVVMGVFIKVCAVHTPSSNPRKPAARKLTLPRRHHGNQGHKPQARSVPVHEPPPPYSSAAHGSGPPPPGHGKHNRHNNNKNGGKNNRGQRYEMQPRAYYQVPYDEYR